MHDKTPATDPSSQYNPYPVRKSCLIIHSPRGPIPVRTRPQRGGGGYPPLYRPQNGCTEQWVLWVPEAPEILF